MNSFSAEAAAAEVATNLEPWNSKNLPTAISWFRSKSDLVAVVSPDQDHEASRALSYGLGNLEGRHLHIIAPLDRARSAIRRLQVFDIESTVYSVDRKGKLGETKAVLAPTDGPTKIGSLRVPRHEWLLDLLRWVELERSLVPMHRHNFRSWRLSGKMVVRLEGKGKPLLIAGVGAKNSVDVSIFEITPSKTSSEMKDIRAAIERGILDAGGKKHHASDEHVMQMALQRNPHLLEMNAPLVREFPAWRPDDTKPNGWGRGFIDLIGQDLVGDISVVETKVGPDAMILLQAIDYWQWVDDHRKDVLAHLQMDKQAESHIRLVLGKKGGKGGHAHAVISQQVKLLKPNIEVSTFLVDDWDSKPRAERIEL